ncbi:c-type cytochrome [Jiella pacifica]|uniref:C-type cytochrome n=1 Tax=Jiella pacifica TaxID=2696469 RepID=A0A6N9T5H7_9HYPH|nr:cytochrome c [Jiella pacifica]NDW05455.1 c-type cytochrome [Jiella pacifica]
MTAQFSKFGRASGLVAGCALLFGGALTAAAEDLSQLAAGQRLLEENCARCHAVTRTGDSPHPEAPPFRTLSERYPVEQIEEALVEGLSTGHPDMPQFIFTPAKAAAIVAYLKSIQAE